MKVLVCGDRNWEDGAMIHAQLAKAKSNAQSPVTVIHGDARGADTLGGLAAQRLKLEVHAFPANWQRFGRGAGPIRNREMLDERPDLVLAFHDDLDNSKGTADMVRIARKAGIPVVVHHH